ncbi:MAG: FAD:protein FMN transferase [Pseudomonadales bacterium]|nr:FAD:protein FMN transferase [Pseudomonadales bacterium]
MEFGVYTFKAMGSPCELRLYGDCKEEIDRVSTLAKAEVSRLESKYSRYRSDSLTHLFTLRAGTGERTQVDPETATLLDYAQVAYEQSDQIFDITSGILRKAWDFTSGKVPTQNTIQTLLPCVGWDKVEWNKPFLYLPLQGMELDFGGYVKEYAVDALLSLCKKEGLCHGLIDLGGDIAVLGPHPTGEAWQVGIRHPGSTEKAMAKIGITKGSLASSGDYERCITIAGKKYGHILNPKTGWPVQSLASVSVLAEQCLVAGTATTIAMLKTQKQASQWLEDLGLPYLLMNQNHQLEGSIALV